MFAVLALLCTFLVERRRLAQRVDEWAAPPGEAMACARRRLCLRLVGVRRERLSRRHRPHVPDRDCGAHLQARMRGRLRAERGVNKLGVDHPVLIALHRPFEHVANAEFFPDLLGVDALALIGDCGARRVRRSASAPPKSAFTWRTTPNCSSRSCRSIA